MKQRNSWNLEGAQLRWKTSNLEGAKLRWKTSNLEGAQLRPKDVQPRRCPTRT